MFFKLRADLTGDLDDVSCRRREIQILYHDSSKLFGRDECFPEIPQEEVAESEDGRNLPMIVDWIASLAELDTQIAWRKR